MKNGKLIIFYLLFFAIMWMIYAGVPYAYTQYVARVPSFDVTYKYSTIILSNFNLTAIVPQTSAVSGTVRSTTSHGGSDMVYCEITCNTSLDGADIGIIDATINPTIGVYSLGFDTHSYGYVKYTGNGHSYFNNVQGGPYTTYNTGDVISIAYNGTANTCIWYLNGTIQFTETGLTVIQWYVAVSDFSSFNNTQKYTINFNGTTDGSWSTTTSTLRTTLATAGYTIGWN